MKKTSRRPQLETLEGRTLLSAGALDTTFGGTGVVTTNLGNSFSDRGEAVVVQPDLKVVVAGITNQSLPHSGFQQFTGLVRYNPDGTLDATFGSGGTTWVPIDLGGGISSGRPTALFLQGDGKLVLVTTYGVTYGKGKNAETRSDWLVVRLNPNGSLDTTFGGGTGHAVIDFGSGNNAGGQFFPYAPDVAITVEPNDGRVVIAGPVDITNSAIDAPGFGSAVARLNANGTKDTTFGPGGWGWAGFGTASAEAVSIDSTGGILVGGIDKDSSNSFGMSVVRYTPAGAVDTSFGSGGETIVHEPANQDYAHGMVLQSDGRIVLGGTEEVSNAPKELVLARLTSQGALDTTFGSSGFYTDPRLQDRQRIAIAGGDKIVAVGRASGTGLSVNVFQVTRVLADGSSADTTFGTNGVTQAQLSGSALLQAYAITVAPDGKVVVAGADLTQDANQSTRFATARFLGDTPAAPLLAATTTATPSAAPIVLDPSAANVVLGTTEFLDSLAFSRPRRAGSHWYTPR